ncbi:MAG TPA: radical SAM protein, partial [Myxococcales bacterium]
MRDIGVYIHFPYCLSKCPYCDFASRAEKVIPQERYTRAVLRELRERAPEFAGRRAVSIYFGGGTPSLWDPEGVDAVLLEVRTRFDVAPSAEITLEANPGTTDEVRFAAFRAAGVNRLSIGVQSFAAPQLVALGRQHSGGDAVRAYRTARAAGFENVSLDLIHGAEGQSTHGAGRDAAAAVALGPEHVSCYALTLTGLAE